jgi:hypothetical protein
MHPTGSIKVLELLTSCNDSLMDSHAQEDIEEVRRDHRVCQLGPRASPSRFWEHHRILRVAAASRVRDTAQRGRDCR